MTSLRINLDITGIDAAIDRAFREDVGGGDRTVAWVLEADADRPSTGRIVAKQEGVVAGLLVALRCYARHDPRIQATATVEDGARVQPGDVVMTLVGPSGGLLTAERTAMNYLGRLSGIASLTRQFVDAIGGLSTDICDTRKTTPGLRTLEKWAVAQGGGTNHRIGLFDHVLIKENHLRAAGIGVAEAVARADRHRQTLGPGDTGAADPSRPMQGQRPTIGVETTSMDEVEQALATVADVVLLDNFSPEQTREAVARRDAIAASEGRRVVLESSGGINLQTVRSYAETGVDRISIGALTHSAPVLDLSCLFDGPTSRDTGRVL